MSNVTHSNDNGTRIYSHSNDNGQDLSNSVETVTSIGTGRPDLIPMYSLLKLSFFVTGHPRTDF
jgi:hypothetical protein